MPERASTSSTASRLSVDETRIYGVPRRNRSTESNLYAYDIASGAVTRVGQLEPAMYAGSHVRDSRGNLYFGRFGSDQGHRGPGRPRDPEAVTVSQART